MATSSDLCEQAEGWGVRCRQVLNVADMADALSKFQTMSQLARTDPSLMLWCSSRDMVIAVQCADTIHSVRDTRIQSALALRLAASHGTNTSGPCHQGPWFVAVMRDEYLVVDLTAPDAAGRFARWGAHMMSGCNRQCVVCLELIHAEDAESKGCYHCETWCCGQCRHAVRSHVCPGCRAPCMVRPTCRLDI